MEIFTRLRHWLEPEPPLAGDLALAIDHAVQIAAPQLKLLSGYQRQLAPAVERTLDYCSDLVNAIPGPHEISPARFASDPLIHALFGSAESIWTTLGRSEDVRDFLSANPGFGDDICYALLGMRPHEKSILGSAMMGDVIHHDVPQTLLYFSDHTVSSLDHDLEAVQRRLRQSAFDSLLHQFAEHTAGLRQQRDALTGELRIKWGSSHHEDVEHNLEQLQQQLMPENLLTSLARWLAAPEQALYLKQVSRTVDRMGVICPADNAPPDAERILFPELVGRDRRIWTVLLVSIPRQEVLAAVAREARAHRYIVI